MAKKTAPVEDVEEVDEDEIELDDTDADVEEDAAPAKSKAPSVEFGVSDLAAYLTEKTGKKITPRDLRTLIRKMAREDTARVDREITPGNRTRYNWAGGLKNAEVKAIVKAVTGGELEADKQAKLEELKTRKAEKTAAAKASGGKGKGKGKAARVTEPEDDDVEEIEIDDDED